MLEMPTAKESLGFLFRIMAEQYDDVRYPDFKAVYQFELEEDGETYCFVISIADGKAVVGEGRHESPSITMIASVAIWLDIASGRLNGAWGLITSKYRIVGPLHYLIKLNKLFTKELTKSEMPGMDEGIDDFELKPQKSWKKPKKVLVMHGSPRGRDGVTWFYLRYLIQGMEQAGVEVETIHLYDKELTIEPCRGCFLCWTKKNGKCVIKDDANELTEKVANSYLTIYAFPLYIDSMPAKLKAFLDRQFITVMPVFVPYGNLTRHPLWNLRERYMALFAISGFPEIEHFKPVIETFRGISRNSHKPLVAEIVRPGAPALYVAPPYRNHLKRVVASLRQAGQDLAEKGGIAKNILNAISSDYAVSKAAWRNNANFFWYREARRGEDE
jgi:putative NADPH-quinone reductase/putative sterol carrier protein